MELIGSKLYSRRCGLVPCASSKAPVSMGAVGALAPTVFESVGASTHGFRQLFYIVCVPGDPKMIFYNRKSSVFAIRQILTEF